ncbi:ATP-binding protein [Dongia sedimenti]|uniref:histidine kinase n=1 Tax=Dongia sedimenti TaxID=3064282 RepID=A0ABU0YU45_9PROT|nr:sensor histidine kinase KdpD [Rhodospirillaceae bacterium R-7]
MTEDEEPFRPEPEALLAEAGRADRGRLKIYLGMAPGVGKTYAMLEGARQAKAAGRDVVVGVVETHGRSETAALVQGLEVVPRRSIAHRGHTLQEFDLAAVLARRPQLVLVDELAHTNAPDCLHPKRWQDVTELLFAGINVYSTLNIQHIESLNDVVARITGVRVRETVPDKILEQADEVELVDLTPTELIERLNQGKVYAPELAGRALEKFFNPGNLAALRELALRRTADRVDDQVLGYMRAHGIEGPWPVNERILVCIGRDPASGLAVRAARRLADQLQASWIALHIERPNAPLPQAAESDPAEAAMKAAMDLGARVERVVGRDLPGEILRFAKRNNVTQIVISRSRGSWIKEILRRSLPHELVRRANGISVHVLTQNTQRQWRWGRDLRLPKGWLPWAGSMAGITAAVVAGELIPDLNRPGNMSTLFMAVVVFSAITFGRTVAAITSVAAFLCYNFFFLDPLIDFRVAHAVDLITLLIFLVVAITIGSLAGTVREQAEAAQARIKAMRALYDFASRLGATFRRDDLVHAVAIHANRVADHQAMVMLADGDELVISHAWPPEDALEPSGWAAARWAREHAEPAGFGTDTLPTADWHFRPIRTKDSIVGVVGIRRRDGERVASGEMLRTLDAVLDQAAVAIERIDYAEEAAKVEALDATDRLRGALLSSVSHDLRTPLTSILGSVTTLRQQGGQLTAEGREELLATIEEEADRLDRFVADLLNMTRLESGALETKADWIDVADLVDSAIRRVARRPKAELVGRKIPGDLPLIRADFVLLENVLMNLIDNALKHALGATQIVLTARRMGNRLELSVTDDGRGIDPDDLPHLFDKFYRAGRTDAGSAGAGLGLSICKGLVEAMGGEITVTSPTEIGRGARFTVSFATPPQPKSATAIEAEVGR